MKTVLVTNGQQRKTLAVIRSLGSKGIRILAAEETRFNPSSFSKYCSQFFVCPSPKEKPKEFYSWLCKTIADHHCDILFPMDDDTMDIVMAHYDELSKLCKIPVPSVESYRIASDKAASTLLAMDAGVPCPESIIPDDVKELEFIEQRISFPALIKPRKSSGARGIAVALDEGELLRKYAEVNEEYPNPMVQKYIADCQKYAVNMVYDCNYRLKACYIQKYLRTFPITNGPSTLTESVDVKELALMAEKIMSKLKWYGVVELEFIQDIRNGQFYFIEINPRFWSSVQGAIYAGVDFPWLLYKAAEKEAFSDCFTYKIGARCRWLLPGDALHYIFNKRRKYMDPPFWKSKKYGIKDDIIQKDDPLPIIGFFLACLRYLFDKKMWKLMFKR